MEAEKQWLENSGDILLFLKKKFKYITDNSIWNNFCPGVGHHEIN